MAQLGMTRSSKWSRSTESRNSPTSAICKKNNRNILFCDLDATLRLGQDKCMYHPSIIPFPALWLERYLNDHATDQNVVYLIKQLTRKKRGSLTSTIYIIRVTLNNEFDTLWLLPGNFTFAASISTNDPLVDRGGHLAST